MPSEENEALKGLGDDAKAVAWHVFAKMAPGEGELRFGTPSRIDPRARVALEELVRLEMVRLDVRKREGTEGADLLVYTPMVDFTPLRGWGRRNRRAGFGMVVDSRPGLDHMTVSC